MYSTPVALKAEQGDHSFVVVFFTLISLVYIYDKI